MYISERYIQRIKEDLLSKLKSLKKLEMNFDFLSVNKWKFYQVKKNINMNVSET